MRPLPQLRCGCAAEAGVEREGELYALVASQRAEIDPHYPLARQVLAERAAAFVQPARREDGDALLRVVRGADQVVAERERELIEPLDVVHDE